MALFLTATILTLAYQAYQYFRNKYTRPKDLSVDKVIEKVNQIAPPNKAISDPDETYLKLLYKDVLSELSELPLNQGIGRPNRHVKAPYGLSTVKNPDEFIRLYEGIQHSDAKNILMIIFFHSLDLEPSMQAHGRYLNFRNELKPNNYILSTRNFLKLYQMKDLPSEWQNQLIEVLTKVVFTIRDDHQPEHLIQHVAPTLKEFCVLHDGIKQEHRESLCNMIHYKYNPVCYTKNEWDTLRQILLGRHPTIRLKADIAFKILSLAENYIYKGFGEHMYNEWKALFSLSELIKFYQYLETQLCAVEYMDYYRKYPISKTITTHNIEVLNKHEIPPQKRSSILQRMILKEGRAFADAVKNNILESPRLELKWKPSAKMATQLFEAQRDLLNGLPILLLCLLRQLQDPQTTKCEPTREDIKKIFRMQRAEDNKIESHIVFKAILDLWLPVKITPSDRKALPALLYCGKKPEATSELFAAPVA